MLDYTFVIRTVGTAGDKYQALLNSISRLTIKPREVLVVLPDGYNLPSERLGWERFVFTPKGMVAQRAFCLNEIKSEYALFCDDDWCFEPKFIEKLSEPVINKRGDISFPILPELLPQGWRTRIIMAVIGSAKPMIFPKQRYTKILNSGSYAYNPYVKSNTLGEFSAESAPGLCFFIKTIDMICLHFEDELWLQNSKYPIPEDQVMFYKFHLYGKKIIGLSGLCFKHLDAGSANKDRDINIAYASSKNKLIFWHRFIFLPKRPMFRSLLKLSYSWMKIRNDMFELLRIIINKDYYTIYKAHKKGYNDAKLFIESEEYKSLKRIVKYKNK